MKTGKLIILTAIILCTAYFLPASGFAYSAIKLKTSAYKAEIKSYKNNSWTFEKDGNNWDLTKNTDGSFNFKKNNTLIAKGTFKNSKLKIYTTDNELFLKIKQTDTKIKFIWDVTENEWVFKIYKDKIKILSNGLEKGKIKYYKDSRKLKAKDIFGETVATAYGFEKLSSFPGVAAVENLPEDRAVFLILFILNAGR